MLPDKLQLYLRVQGVIRRCMNNGVYVDNGGGTLNLVHCFLQRLRKLGPVDHTLFPRGT